MQLISKYIDLISGNLLSLLLNSCSFLYFFIFGDEEELNGGREEGEGEREP